MTQYAPIKIKACNYDAPVGYNRLGDNSAFPNLNTAFKYFEKEACWKFPCGCEFDIKEIADTAKIATWVSLSFKN